MYFFKLCGIVFEQNFQFTQCFETVIKLACNIIDNREIGIIKLYQIGILRLLSLKDHNKFLLVLCFSGEKYFLAVRIETEPEMSIDVCGCTREICEQRYWPALKRFRNLDCLSEKYSFLRFCPLERNPDQSPPFFTGQGRNFLFHVPFFHLPIQERYPRRINSFFNMR